MINKRTKGTNPIFEKLKSSYSWNWKFKSQMNHLCEPPFAIWPPFEMDFYYLWVPKLFSGCKPCCNHIIDLSNSVELPQSFEFVFPGEMIEWEINCMLMVKMAYSDSMDIGLKHSNQLQKESIQIDKLPYFYVYIAELYVTTSFQHIIIFSCVLTQKWMEIVFKTYLEWISFKRLR